MSDAVYVRFNDEELDLIKTIAKEDNITRSEAIKKLVDYAAEKLKIERSIKNYKEGKNTIRECAAMTNLRYFEFFEILAKENLIGTDPKNIDIQLRKLMK